MDVDDEHEVMARALWTQAPVVLADDWMLLDEVTCLAWLEVRLHRPGALLLLHVAHQEGAEHDPFSSLRLSRWFEEDEVDVEVEFLVDGEPAGHGAQDRPDRDGVEPTRPIGLCCRRAGAAREASSSRSGGCPSPPVNWSRRSSGRIVRAGRAWRSTPASGPTSRPAYARSGLTTATVGLRRDAWCRLGAPTDDNRFVIKVAGHAVRRRPVRK